LNSLLIVLLIFLDKFKLIIWYSVHITISTEIRMRMQEKFSLLQENEKLLKSNKKLNQEKETLLKNKDLADAQIGTLTKSLEAMQKDIRDKENQVVYF